MKMKLYYGALALLWLLSSCTPSSNVTDNHDKVGTCRNGHIKALTLNGHTYYWQNHWFAHAGDCKKCKHVSDVEKDLAGPAYPRGIPTYVVLEELKSRMPEDELVIITTPETYKDIPEWHKGSVILCDYKFLMVVSGEETPQDLPKNVHVVYVPQITICSTCIRNRVKLGIYIQPFVRDTVEAFIDQYRLYV